MALPVYLRCISDKTDEPQDLSSEDAANFKQATSRSISIRRRRRGGSPEPAQVPGGRRRAAEAADVKQGPGRGKLTSGMSVCFQNSHSQVSSVAQHLSGQCPMLRSQTHGPGGWRPCFNPEDLFRRACPSMPDSHSTNSCGESPRVEKFEGCPLPAGNSPLKTKNRLRSKHSNLWILHISRK